MDARQYRAYLLVLLIVKDVSDKYSGQLKTFDYVDANPPRSEKRCDPGLDPANDPHDVNQHLTKMGFQA